MRAQTVRDEIADASLAIGNPGRTAAARARLAVAPACVARETASDQDQLIDLLR
jgi:hypothetical protein